MSVKVIKHKVFDGNKTYEVGDVIKGLSEKDESQLVLSGIVEYVYTESEMKQDNMVNDIDKKDELKGDTEIPPNGEESSSENEKTSTESGENQSDLIDPNSLALKPDDYVKDSSPKGKKEKVV
jgi:hypothetical protein